MKVLFWIRASFLMLVFAAVAASAQNLTSTILGQVNDPSGKGVPNTSIKITNVATGIATPGKTDSSGFYSVSGLQPGTYKVAASASGFSTSEVSGIVVNALATVRVNVALTIGTVTQMVHVSGAAPLITTDSPSIGLTLNMHQVRALPSSVQDIASLIQLVPGSAANSGSFLANPNISGSLHWGASNFTLNGVSLDDISNGGGSYAFSTADVNTTMINEPPIDTLQEFRVLSVDENAEFGSMNTVTMVTKQGTNQFHGDLYEFLNNADLNANSFQLNAEGLPRPKNNLNQFGGTIGGPILKNKAFFFFAPIFYRAVTSDTAQLTWPSKAMQQGDFSALLAQNTQLYNPLTGKPFPNNQIPTDMFAPQAVALLKYLPAPTVSTSLGLPNGAPNFFQSVPIHDYMNSYTLRLDGQINSHDSIFGVYTSSVTPEWNIFDNFSTSFGNESNYGFADHSVSIGEAHTFNLSTLNQFRFAWFKHVSFRIGDNTDFNPASLFPQLTPGISRGLPTLSVAGYTDVGADHGNSSTGGIYTVEFNDNLTKVLGNHTLKFGFDESGYKDIALADLGGLGSFSFSGNWTGNKGWPGQPQSQGNSFADYLLGDANEATLSTPDIAADIYNRITGGYGQDTWQVAHHLTLDYGLRYMYQAIVEVQHNARSFYDAANNKIALPENSMTPTVPVGGNAALFDAFSQYFETTKSIGLPTHYMEPSKGNFSPRIGFAYRILPHTVLRGGYGVYYDFLITEAAAYDSYNLPFGSTPESAISELPGNPTSPYLPDITFADPFGSATNVISLHPTIASVQRDIKNPRIQQINLTLERQFGSDWMGRASYVGTFSRNMVYYREDLDQPAQQIPNVPYQDQRPVQPWDGIEACRTNGNAFQNFNELQLEVERRFDNGISFQAQYAWTRSLDDVSNFFGPQQVRYPLLDYGNSDSIPKNQLVFNYVYSLPFGSGRKFLDANSTLSMTNELVGGWQVSGISTYASGAPFSVDFSAPSNYIGWEAGRADRVPGVPVYLTHSNHNIINGVPYFNPAAFAPPKPWTWGTSARNSLWGPGMWNWDISALKRFAVPGRVKVSLRADLLDAFNHFNLGTPDATISSSEYGGLAEPLAGVITTGSGNRTVQLGLRLSF